MAVEWAAIAAAAGALFGASSGLVGALQSDRQAREQAAAEKENVLKMYALNLARAEEEFKKAKAEAERNAKQAELQADITDKTLDITEQGLSQDFNTTIDNLYMSQEADTMNWNLAAMQAGSSEGAAYSQLAGSGVRAGSSLSDAVLMESAVNENQLQFSQDQKRRSDDNNLGTVLNNLAGNKVNIQNNRIGADITRDNAAYLRNSYLEGGHNYNLYQNQKDLLQAQMQANVNKLDYEYGQHADANAFWNTLTSMLSLGAKGAQTGYSLYDMGYKASNYSTAIGG